MNQPKRETKGKRRNFNFPTVQIPFFITDCPKYSPSCPPLSSFKRAAFVLARQASQESQGLKHCNLLHFHFRKQGEGISPHHPILLSPLIRKTYNGTYLSLSPFLFLFASNQRNQNLCDHHKLEWHTLKLVNLNHASDAELDELSREAPPIVPICDPRGTIFDCCILWHRLLAGLFSLCCKAEVYRTHSS